MSDSTQDSDNDSLEFHLKRRKVDRFLRCSGAS